jgi:hypothetical protein
MWILFLVSEPGDVEQMQMPQVPSETRESRLMRLPYLLIFLPIILISLLGCTRNQIDATIGVGEIFTIGVGQSARINGEDMEITFDEVIGDSRCPKNVTCVWAGVASSRVTIIHKGVNYSLALNQPGLTEQAKEIFIDYTLNYSLNPYPIAGKEISHKDYRLTISLTK